MPYRKKNARRKPARGKSARKPGYRRRKTVSKQTKLQSGALKSYGVRDIFPVGLTRVLTFSLPVTLIQQGVTSVPTIYEFRGNSVYDPDYTGAGGQARWVDTFLGPSNSTYPYSRYMVTKSKIRVTVYPSTGLASGNALGTVFIQPIIGASGVAATSMQDIMEMPLIKSKECMGGGVAPNKPFSFSHTMTTKKIWGCKDLSDDDDYQAEYNNNPANQWRWVVGVCNNITGGTFAAYLKVEIDYTTVFLKQNMVAPS